MSDEIRHDRFQGPVTLQPPTLEMILPMLGVGSVPEAEQRAAIAAAVQAQQLAPLQLAELRNRGWID